MEVGDPALGNDFEDETNTLRYFDRQGLPGAS